MPVLRETSVNRPLEREFVPVHTPAGTNGSENDGQIRNIRHIELAGCRANRQHSRSSVPFTKTIPRAKLVPPLPAETSCPPAPLNIRLGVTALEDRTVPASWMIYLNSIFKEETKTVPNFSGTMPRKWGYQGITHKNFECLVP